MSSWKAVFLLATSALVFMTNPVIANPRMYENYLSARRACQRWASEGETIYTSTSSHVKFGNIETDSFYPSQSKYAGRKVYISLIPILLRTCKFDYDTTAYIGYQHKGISPVPSWWPKTPDGNDWTYNGKIVRIFRRWNVGEGSPVYSYPF